MQTLLCQDQDTNPLVNEAGYFTRLVSLYDFARANYDGNVTHFFRDRNTLFDFHKRLTVEFLDHVAQLYGQPATLVLKNPELTRCFAGLNELVEHAKFICMVRDPRDAIASMLEVARKKQQVIGPYFAQNMSRHFLSFYATVLNPAHAALANNLLFVRYEDLVRQPQTVLERLREFTGLSLGEIDPDSDFDTGAVDYEHATKAWSDFITDLYGKAISPRKVGRYRADLQPPAIETIERQCASFAKRYDYW